MSEAALQLNNVSYHCGGFRLSADFTVHNGELFSVIGPSGSGKSTLLSVISGLLPCATGSITMSDRDMTFKSPEQRKTGMVFQDYALFPHMNVAQNVGYSLKAKHLGKKETVVEVDRLLNLVNLGGYQKRKVQDLSGGEKQRVAIARALAAKPDILLLDEPLSALDARLRTGLREEIRKIIKTSGTTAIYVTHDIAEAMAISDRIMVVNNGQIEQIGTPEEIYRNPRTIFVAQFTGLNNTIPYGVLADNIVIPPEDRSRYEVKNMGQEHLAFFRPEDVTLTNSQWLKLPQLSAHMQFDNVEVVDCMFQGRDYLVTCDFNGIRLLALSKDKPTGRTVSLTVPVSEVTEFFRGHRIDPLFRA